MFNENQFIQWLFKYDDELLFQIFSMRIALCNQSMDVREHVLQQGLEAVRAKLQQKIRHWQEKQKLINVSPAFFQAIEKTIRKTLSYSYSPDAIAQLLKTLVEVYIKDGNPAGVHYYLSEIAKAVEALLPRNNPQARQRFQQFWQPIQWHDATFTPQYYRTRINQSRPMQLWMRVLASLIVITIFLILFQQISLITGLGAIGSMLVINYLSRSAWRFSALIQHKSSLSEEALKESQSILLDLVSLQHVYTVTVKPSTNLEQTSKKEALPSGALDLVPAWHEVITTYSPEPLSVSRKPKKPKSTTPAKLEKTKPHLPMSKPIELPTLYWKGLKYPAIYDPRNPHKTNAYMLYSSHFTYSTLFGRLNPVLSKSMPKEESEHFQKVVERGRLIPRKSRGIQGIKPAFHYYENVFGDKVFSDYKLKIPGHNGEVFGHEVATEQYQNKAYTVIDFDGYDPNAHEKLYRKTHH